MKSKSFDLWSGVVVCLLVCNPAPALAAGYTFTTVDFPVSPHTTLIAIDGFGRILGNYGAGAGFGGGLPVNGFLLDRGKFSTVDFPGSNFTIPLGLAVPEEIVGYYAEADGVTLHGFVREGGTYRSVDAPFAGAAGTTVLTDINLQRQIVGAYTAIPGHVGLSDSGFLLDRGSFTVLPQFPGSLGTAPFRISIRGDIMGFWIDPNGVTWHGFLLSGGSFTRLDDPEAGKTNCTGLGQLNYPNCSTEPFGMNDQGQIVGWFIKDDGTVHGFLLSKGVYTTLDFPGAVITQPSDINDAGRIVGAYLDSAGVTHGFLATPQ
jgi:probable HAF family extracellular repeat protein